MSVHLKASRYSSKASRSTGNRATIGERSSKAAAATTGACAGGGHSCVRGGRCGRAGADAAAGARTRRRLRARGRRAGRARAAVRARAAGIRVDLARQQASIARAGLSEGFGAAADVGAVDPRGERWKPVESPQREVDSFFMHRF